MYILITLIMLWNLCVFLIYGYDKLMAKLGKRRIRERTLYIISLLFGGVGAFAGMQCFRHKTKHKSFNIIVPVAFIITLSAVFALLYNGGYLK